MEWRCRDDRLTKDLFLWTRFVHHAFVGGQQIESVFLRELELDRFALMDFNVQAQANRRSMNRNGLGHDPFVPVASVGRITLRMARSPCKHIDFIASDPLEGAVPIATH